MSKPVCDTQCLVHAGLELPFGNGMLCVHKRFVLYLLGAAAALEDATHTSGAALRPGTAAVVKRSAGLVVASVSPRGSVTAPSSGEQGGHRHSDLEWLRQCCRFLTAQAGGPRMLHKGDIRPHLCSWIVYLFCTLMIKSCGARTLPPHASKR